MATINRNFLDWFKKPMQESEKIIQNKRVIKGNTTACVDVAKEGNAEFVVPTYKKDDKASSLNTFAVEEKAIRNFAIIDTQEHQIVNVLSENSERVENSVRIEVLEEEISMPEQSSQNVVSVKNTNTHKYGEREEGFAFTLAGTNFQTATAEKKEEVLIRKTPSKNIVKNNTHSNVQNTKELEIIPDTFRAIPNGTIKEPVYLDTNTFGKSITLHTIIKNDGRKDLQIGIEFSDKKEVFIVLANGHKIDITKKLKKNNPSLYKEYSILCALAKEHASEDYIAFSLETKENMVAKVMNSLAYGKGSLQNLLPYFPDTEQNIYKDIMNGYSFLAETIVYSQELSLKDRKILSHHIKVLLQTGSLDIEDIPIQLRNAELENFIANVKGNPHIRILLWEHATENAFNGVFGSRIVCDPSYSKSSADLNFLGILSEDLSNFIIPQYRKEDSRFILDMDNEGYKKELQAKQDVIVGGLPAQLQATFSTICTNIEKAEKLVFTETSSLVDAMRSLYASSIFMNPENTSKILEYIAEDGVLENLFTMKSDDCIKAIFQQIYGHSVAQTPNLQRRNNKALLYFQEIFKLMQPAPEKGRAGNTVEEFGIMLEALLQRMNDVRATTHKYIYGKEIDTGDISFISGKPCIDIEYEQEWPFCTSEKLSVAEHIKQSGQKILDKIHRNNAKDDTTASNIVAEENSIDDFGFKNSVHNTSRRRKMKDRIEEIFTFMTTGKISLASINKMIHIFLDKSEEKNTTEIESIDLESLFGDPEEKETKF